MQNDGALRATRFVPTEIEDGPVVGPWRCFHCDEVCETAEAAEHHFGRHDGCTPICQVAAETYRALEREVESYRTECDADTVLFYSLGAKHSVAVREAEQAGYDKGLRDGRSERWWRRLIGYLATTPTPSDRQKGEG